MIIIIVLEEIEHFLTLLLCTFSLYLCFEARYDKKVTYTLYFLLQLSLFLFLSLIQLNSFVFFVLFLLTDFIFLFLFTESKFNKIAFFSLVKVCLLMLGEDIDKVIFNFEQTGESTISLLLSGMLNLLILELNIIIFQKKKEKINRINILLFSLVLIFQIFLSGFFFGNATLSYELKMAGDVIEILSACILIVVILSTARMIKAWKQEEKLSLILEMRKMELECFNLAKEQLYHIHCIKHDFKNQLQTVYQILTQFDENKENIAENMIAELELKLDAVSTLVLCENLVVNAVVSVKKDIAIKNNIDTLIEIIIPELIGIKKIDLCSIFSNLLDNAIEGCKSITSPNIRKYINLKASIKSGFLVIKIENSKGNKIILTDGKIKSTKKEENHGYGLELIEKIAEKYDGSAEFDYTDDRFISFLMLRAENSF